MPSASTPIENKSTETQAIFGMVASDQPPCAAEAGPSGMKAMTA